jgi:cyanophycin synthetase
MELWRLWVLRGPNAWAACPVLEAGLGLGDGAAQAQEPFEQAVGRVRAWLPSLASHPSFGLADLIERVTLHLQTLAGSPVQFGATRPLPRPGRYRIAVEYQEETVARACLRTALELCRAAAAARSFPIDEELRLLRELAGAQRPGPTTQAIVEAARARGIPVDYLNPDDGRYLQLGHGARQRRTLAAETDDISAVARSVATDRQLTRELLRDAGVPVPKGRPVTDAEDAWEAACDLGLPVAVKPQDRDLAQGVGLDLRTREQVVAAYLAARQKSPSVLVERFVLGTAYRVLVVDDRVAAVARLSPARVVGDGRSSVAELVAANRRNPPDLEDGGGLSDVTDRVHPDVAACAVEAARALQLRVAGLEVIADDISRPLEEQGGAVVEVHTGPGLWLHLRPWTETPRPVGDAIVATLFPPGSDGRIPVVAVAGARAHAAAGRHLAGLLARRGRHVGRASAEGVFVGDRRIPMPGTTARERARAVLRNNLVEAAVLEATPRDLLHDGLGCDRCDVAVVTDLPAAADGAELAEACGAVLRALAMTGTAVLDADNPPPLASLLPPATRIVWFSRECRNPRVFAHRAAGGTAVWLGTDAVVLAHGAEEKRLGSSVSLRDMGPPEQLGLLAALAAGMALDPTGEDPRSWLAAIGGVGRVAGRDRLAVCPT